MNIGSSLIAELKDKAYRDAYVASQIRIGLPLQNRALRKSREWSQEQLAERARMAQPRISEIESPGERSLNIETLLRLASAFDVGLQIRFVPFSELIDWSEGLDLDTLVIKPFEQELEQAERAQTAAEKPNPVYAHRPRIKGSLELTPRTAGNHLTNVVTFATKQPALRGQSYAAGATMAARKVAQ